VSFSVRDFLVLFAGAALLTLIGSAVLPRALR